MKTRENTWDSKIVEMVRVQNEYRLPEDMSGWTVVDIGAHIGGFAMACKDRNVARIISYEPDHDNFELLAQNIGDKALLAQREEFFKNEKPVTEIRIDLPIIVDTCEIWRCAVSGQATMGFGVRHLTDHDFGPMRNTGHVDIFGGADGTLTFGIEEVLKGLNVDLLKIDCEGSEWSIFEHGDFSNVKRIVAELHAVPPGEHPMLFALQGIPLDDLAANAKAKLEKAGFEVFIRPTSDVTQFLSAERVPVRTEVPGNRKPRLLWVGDAVVKTGYARVTHNICKRLKSMGWDVRVLGIGYDGDPHSLGYPIYPAAMAYRGGDPMGVSRIAEIVKQFQPDVCLIHNDSWNVAAMVEQMILQAVSVPTVGYIAVDSENVRDDVAAQLRNLKLAIFHTGFGREQARLAGYSGRTEVIGHGVSPEIYQPIERTEARRSAGIIESVKDAFVWGSVNMNQPRKRLDLVIAYFAAWWNKAGRPKSAYLYLHTDKQGAWDLGQLCQYYGIRHGNVLMTKGGSDLAEGQMSYLYSCFDAQLSVAEGESWGLTHLEGMACGVPQIAVRCGGMPEWAEDGIRWVDPSVYVFTPNTSNSKRWIAAEQPFVEAMDEIYGSPEVRENYRTRGLGIAAGLSWDAAALEFHRSLTGVIEQQRKAAAVHEDCLAEF